MHEFDNDEMAAAALYQAYTDMAVGQCIQDDAVYSAVANILLDQYAQHELSDDDIRLFGEELDEWLRNYFSYEKLVGHGDSL